MEVTADSTKIYSRPAADSWQMDTRRGDLFEAESYISGWVVITLFSGAKRYIERVDVAFSDSTAEYSISSSRKEEICASIDKAEKRALRESRDQYPQDYDQQGRYELFLIDKYLLEVFRSRGIPATARLSCPDS